MSTFKCKMCGGTLEIQSGSTVVECEYCGAKQTLPKLDDEKRANLYDRANHFRRSNEFDKASAIYEQILAEDNTDAETYWSLVLCRYGIEYVEDPLSHRRVPTVHRAQFTSIFDDDNYKSALKNSDTYQRVIYEEEAKAINEIQKGILAISQKEEPFDVFICYKETDDSGKRTHDSVLAQDLYYQLKQEGFKVFFSRITLEDKLGSAYEPYIFAALNSAKVMVVLGTKPEYFNAVWVKNEWSRFLSLIKNGEKKMLIPAYKDMDPYNLPKEFSHLQAQDMSKLGFMQDLIRGIKKILGRDKKPAAPTVDRVVVQGDSHAQDAAPLLRRAFLFCEDGEFDNADEYAEKVLDINPECAEAYVVKLLIELELKKSSDLAQCKAPISDSPNYQKALRFATPEYRETIEGYNNSIIKRIDTARKDEVYARGVELMKLHRYDEAVQYFQKIPTYKDSTQKVDDCRKLAETERRDGIYQRATQLLNAGQFDEAARLFESIEDHKDSKEKIKLCGERKENARKDAIYSQAMNRVRPQNADDVEIKKSIEELQTISGYRDVDDQLRALNARLEKWYEDKKKAEEAARIKAEEDRRTREREAELRRIKAEKTKKTVKKVAKIGIPSVVALATLLILLFTLVIPLIRYNKADELFNAGKYDEAMEIYQDIGGFSESEQRVTVLTGMDNIDNAKFEDGIKKILSAGVPVKLTYGMGGGDFSGATYLSATQEENNNGIVLLSASTTSDVTPLATTTASVPEATEFTYNSSADFSGIQTPGRSGYRFVKWELETYNYQIGGTFEMKLNAVWSEKEYTIEYDLNDGKVTTNNPVEYGIEDDSFTLINPTKTGYTFIGWTGTGLDGLTMSVTIEKGSVGDRSYEANWQANTYTITLNPNGGSIANTTITVTYDQAYTLNDPEWTGHTFGGWYEGNKKVTSGTWTRTSNLELTAKWDIVEYDITYNLNSDTNSSSNPATYTVDDEVILVAPTRTGYTFAGWTYVGQTTPVLSVTIPVGTTGDKTYTANWTADSFTLTFNADGGSVSPESKTVTYDTSFTLPPPTKSGYTFAGWFNGTKQYTNGTWKETVNVTLKAKWTANSYVVTYDDTAEARANVVVTFNYNFSGSTPTTVTLSNGQKLNYPTNPTRSGYVFAGWYTNSSCNTVYNFSGTITTDMTLYAGWKNCTITNNSTYSWSSSGGVLTSTNKGNNSSSTYTITATMPVTISFSYKTSSESGYDYLYIKKNGSQLKSCSGSTSYVSYSVTLNNGDYLEFVYSKDGSSSSGSDCAYIKDIAYTSNVSYTSTATASCSTVIGYVYDTSSSVLTTVTFGSSHTLPTLTRTGYTFLGWYNENTKVESGNWSIASNVTLVSKWQANTFTITFNSNGGSISPTSQTVTYDSPYTLPTPTWAGHTFSGWYNGSTKITSGTWNYTIGMNLTAQWDSVVYTVSYTMNGGTNNSSNPSTYTVNDSFTLKDPTKTGYTFLGWTYSGQTTPTKNVTISTGTMGNLSYTANWKVNDYTVTFDANGGSVTPTSKTVTYDASYTVPTSTRTGYTFAGWYAGSTKYTGGTWKTASNTTLTAKWTARTDIPYVVNHYQQNANDDGYTLKDVQNLTGTADSTIKPGTKSYTHFKSPYVQSVTVKPDGSLVVNYYYDRVTYDLTYVTKGGDAIATETYKYAQTLVIATPVREGFTFGGWFTDKSLGTPYAATATLNADTTIYAYWSEENKPTDFTYTGTTAYSITGYTGTSTTAWIPTYIGGVPVTTVSVSTFKNKTDLVKIVIPDTVTKLETAMFEGCTNLAELVVPFVNNSAIDTAYFSKLFKDANDNSYIPSSLTKVTITNQTIIPNYVFYNCKYIEEINIPTSTTSIGSYAFNGCSELLRLNSTVDGVFNVPESVTEIKSYAFTNCLLAETINLGDDVTAIRTHAFEGCKSLTAFTIPATVEIIESYAFNGCISIMKINSTVDGELNISTSVKTIGAYAFKGLAGITKVTIPNNVTSLGDAVFQNCTCIEEMTLPFMNNGKTDTSYFNILFYTSNNDNSNVPSSLNKVTITNQTVIPDYAFYNCKYIEEINIPTNTTSIGSHAFYGCSALLRLNSTVDGVFNIPENITEVKTYTFYNCPLAEVVNVGESIINIKDYAFAKCASIKKFNSSTEGEFILPESVRVISPHAFEGLTSITKVVIPDSVSAINNDAFRGCNSIAEITLPFIGQKKGLSTGTSAVFGYIFGYNTGSIYNHPSENYDIPNSIKVVTITAQTVIPEYAFRNCSFIETIILPSTVTSVGTNSFYGCTASVSYTYSATTSIWNGTDISTSFIGSGTEADPYQINNAADLAYLANSVNAGESYEGKYFILNTNINLNTKSWTPIGTKNKAFAGIFDGNNKKIYNLSVTMDTAYAGLFGYVSGTIKNLGIESGTLAPVSKSATTYVGPLVAYLTGTVENCYSKAAVNTNITNIVYAGGLIGHIDSTGVAKNCYASGHISAISTSGFAYAGGFVGSNAGTIEGAVAFGNVKAQGSNEVYSRNGGFVATNEGTLTECYKDETQILTKYTTIGNVYCEDGIGASSSDIINYCKDNWSSSIWDFNGSTPKFK